MNKLIVLIIILIAAEDVNSQNTLYYTIDSSFQIEYAKIKCSDNFDVNISLTQGFSYNKYNNVANFHYVNFDVGYKIKYNHEIGLCLGDDNLIWYGAYYKMYFDEGINLGLKIAKNDGIHYMIYNEFTLGKDFKVTNNFYFRTDLFYSINSRFPFGIINNRDNKFGLLLGISYLE